MPITFRCSDCTQKLRVDDELAGKRVACVRCGSKQRVPLVTSPEFSQPGQAPRKSPKLAPPASPPQEQEPAAPEPTRRESPRPAIPPAPIWFKSVRSTEGKHAPSQPAPPELEPEPEPEPQLELRPEAELEFEPEPEPKWAPAEPIASHQPLTEQEPIDAERALFIEAPEEQPEPEVFRQDKPQPVPRRPAVPAAHAEPSLVPPYKKLDVEEMIDMTAMVDIVFFLLIFFLVTSMHALDSTIPMPTPDPQKGAAREPKSVATIDSDDSYVVVRIDRNDKILIEGSEVRTDRELLFKLGELRRGSAHPEKLLVVGHGDATHGTVVMVLDAGRELGMDQVRLTMQDEPE